MKRFNRIVGFLFSIVMVFCVGLSNVNAANINQNQNLTVYESKQADSYELYKKPQNYFKAIINKYVIDF